MWCAVFCFHVVEEEVAVKPFWDDVGWGACAEAYEFVVVVVAHECAVACEDDVWHGFAVLWRVSFSFSVVKAFWCLIFV